MAMGHDDAQRDIDYPKLGRLLEHIARPNRVAAYARTVLLAGVVAGGGVAVGALWSPRTPLCPAYTESNAAAPAVGLSAITTRDTVAASGATGGTLGEPPSTTAGNAAAASDAAASSDARHETRPEPGQSAPAKTVVAAVPGGAGDETKTGNGANDVVRGTTGASPAKMTPPNTTPPKSTSPNTGAAVTPSP